MTSKFDANAKSILDSIKAVKAERDMWRKVATGLYDALWADRRTLTFTAQQGDAIEAFDAALKQKDGDA